MRTLLEKSIVVSFIILITSAFNSCNTRVIEDESEVTVIENLAENIKEITYQEPVVFIAGFDKGNDTFYADARSYFKNAGLKVIDGKYSLEEIIFWLNDNGTQHVFSDVHIVTKSNSFTGMNLETVVRGEKITSETLRRSITQGVLPKLNAVVNNNSKIIFHVSGLLENKALLKTLKDAFYTLENPQVIASPYQTIFGGKFSAYHLAQPYYIFYPTAYSPGKIDLSKEMAQKYPQEKEIDWYDALNNEEERYVGEAYTTQFNIPIKWVFDYFNTDNKMPKFTTADDVIYWIEQQDELLLELKKYNVSVEKFRWTWTVQGSTLTVRGLTTGLCVLKPLIKPYGDLEHIQPDTSNKRLYASY